MRRKIDTAGQPCGTAANTAKRGKLLLGVLFMLVPLSLFAQDTRRVALIPFWGEDETIIRQFGEELFFTMAGMAGFDPVLVDMENLPPDVPPGGFPPFVAPSLSLTGDAPFAVTGNVVMNPITQSWNLRFFLWQMDGNRLIFSEEMAAPDRAFAAVIMPFVLESLMAQIPEEAAAPETIVVEVPVDRIVEVPVEVIVEVPVEVIVEVPVDRIVEVPVEVIVEVPSEFFVERIVEIEVERIVEVPVPAVHGGPHMIVLEGQQQIVMDHGGVRERHNWLYLGLRAGGNLQMFNPLWSAETFDSMHWENISASAHLNIQFFRFAGLQFEAVAMQDFRNDAFSLMFPAMLRLTARWGSSSFSVLGGAYLFVPLDDGLGPLGGDSDILFVHENDFIAGFMGSTGWGYTAGIGIGNRIGRGYIFTEVRWSHDMFSSYIRSSNYFYSRSVITVSVGFELGFINRRR